RWLYRRRSRRNRRLLRLLGLAAAGQVGLVAPAGSRVTHGVRLAAHPEPGGLCRPRLRGVWWRLYRRQPRLAVGRRGLPAGSLGRDRGGDLPRRRIRHPVDAAPGRLIERWHGLKAAEKFPPVGMRLRRGPLPETTPSADRRKRGEGMESLWSDSDARSAIDRYGREGVNEDVALRTYTTR